MAAKRNVTALATVTGILLVSRPNDNQSKVPTVNSQYIDKEMPEVSLVRMVLTACGIKEAVVQMAAAKPIMVIQLIVIKSSFIIFAIVNCIGNKKSLTLVLPLRWRGSGASNL